jgi:hypothetical protein
MIIIALKKILLSLNAASTKFYHADEVLIEDLPKIEQECVGTSTSAFRFFLLLKVINIEDVKIFKVYNDTETAVHGTSFRYDIVLVTRDGLLATTSEDFQAYGLPDESIWALWFLGYIQINTVMHISCHWFQKDYQRLQSVAVDENNVEAFNILSNRAITDKTKFVVNTSNKHSFDKCVEVSKDAWDKVVGTMTTNKTVPKVFAPDIYRKKFSGTQSIDCYSKDWHRNNCIKAISLYQKENFEFQMQLAQLIQKEYIRQTSNAISSKSFQVQLTDSSLETKKLYSVGSTDGVIKAKKRLKRGNSYILINSHTFSYILIHSHIFSYILIHSQIFSYILTYSHIFSYENV